MAPRKKHQRAASRRRRSVTRVERFFEPGVKYSRRVLDDARLPTDVTRLVRLCPDDTWVDNMRSWIDLQPAEQAVSSQHLAEQFWGKGSDQDYAARFLWEYNRMVASLDRRDYDFAMYIAARLGMLATEADSRAGLQLGRRLRSERATERKEQILARATQIRDKQPRLSVTSIAKIIAKELARSDDEENRIGERQIRRYLTEPQ